MRPTLRSCFRSGAGLWPALLLAGCGPVTEPSAAPPGAPKSAASAALEAGAAALQGQAPLRRMDVYLVGFHVDKNNPALQMEAHHFCAEVNEDFLQCALFDGNAANANLVGIEYIISETLFERLPEDEKKYWHPHNYEILSGTLAAPGIPAAAEHELMRRKLNSYGKTWHLWNADPHEGHGDTLPVGGPLLAWSFNRDGESLPFLVEDRDRRMGIATLENRLNRADLVPLARPQAGVDALKGQFPGTTVDLPGVADRKSAPK